MSNMYRKQAKRIHIHEPNLTSPLNSISEER